MKSSLAAVGDRHVGASSGPSPEVLIAVAEVGRELAAAGELEARLGAALRVLERRLGAGRSVVYASVSETRTLSVVASHGLDPDAFRARYAAGVAGRVAATAQPVVVPVLRHDAMALSEISDLSRWADSGWNLVCLPVAGRGRCIGVLCAYFRHRDPAGFSERLSVLDVVAGLIGKAMRGDRENAEAPANDEPNARAAATQFEYANMIGDSVVMRQIYEQVSQVARTNATALLRGESGTGKELVARAIHQNSPRANQPFIKVNCAALPESLFESELFGHERGAFTGAHARKKGRFELAQGGTLFLDEIGELPLTTQAKLLRVLQFREFERLGGTETLHTDVRIVAATNVDIERAVASGVFREDLYYRVNIFTITLPPLRDRPNDIPALAEYFMRKFGLEHQRKIGRISSAAMDLLCRQPFPGNVRELENLIERAVVVCKGSVIQETDLPHTLRVAASGKEKLTLSEAVERLERQLIGEALEAEGGNMVGAARALGITERIVRYKIRKLQISLDRFRR
ncbi:MAG TPA: sigma-54-dependent Fis family transcriptional regulator [Polyangiaceae bacterium]|jgi:Nif-specific regulatory protein|nr:sigma-54-dependent Fis family transcriptional regulator [Polyangiaceae bacterium]